MKSLVVSFEARLPQISIRTVGLVAAKPEARQLMQWDEIESEEDSLLRLFFFRLKD